MSEPHELSEGEAGSSADEHFEQAPHTSEKWTLVRLKPIPLPPEQRVKPRRGMIA